LPLIENVELIATLEETKSTSVTVMETLKDAAEQEESINERRKAFTSVATRGALMYFCMTDMTNITMPPPLDAIKTGWMYNCSLGQFLVQFDYSVNWSDGGEKSIEQKLSKKNNNANKRAETIVDYMTYKVYRYMNRGLYVRDQLTFKLMATLKIAVVAGDLNNGDVANFLKAGSSLSMADPRNAKKFKWMSDPVWLNTLFLTRTSFGAGSGSPFFKDLEMNIEASIAAGKGSANGQGAWQNWIDENAPESCPIPDFEERLSANSVLGPFLRMLLVRCMREDRTSVCCQQYIAAQIGSKFTDPVTDQIADMYEETACNIPVLYLLSKGNDPTLTIQELAKKKKKFPTQNVSMGEGQEKPAREKMFNGFLNGDWVILQNCHLGIGYMEEQEGIFGQGGPGHPDGPAPDYAEGMGCHPEFRLWITSDISTKFPIGLLQMCVKSTLEPPAGLKAGLDRTYSTMVNQDVLDKVDSEKWRQIVFSLAFTHSVVQERRKFGAIGWCVPYEYNSADFEASMTFLERYLGTCIPQKEPLSWIQIVYMIVEVQYGGRITDNLDRELFNAYGQFWFCDDIFKNNFKFNRYPNEFDYVIPKSDNPEIESMEPFVNYIKSRQWNEEIRDWESTEAVMPAVDSPNIYGLHTNADLTYRLKEAAST